MNVAQSLRSLSAYPIPAATLQDIAEGVGLAPDAEVTQEVRRSREFRVAQAQTYMFLAETPNVTQNGINFYITEEERRRLRGRAEAILDLLGEEDMATGITFGYQGEDL